MTSTGHLIERQGRSPRLTGDTGLALALFVIGVVSRIPFHSQLLYHWDSVNFALGMERFDVRLHQPHPPGYLLYVLLGQLVNALTGDANTSLVWISIVFGGLTVSGVYLLGRRLFGRSEALIGALFALTMPAFWFYGEVALTYIIEAFFVTAIAIACLDAMRGSPRAAFASAILLGLAGGIRQTTLVLMLPVWLFSLRRIDWRRRCVALGLLALTCAGWFAPTVILSGGLADYLEASRAIGGGVLASLELFKGGTSFLDPFARLGMYSIYGLMLGLVAIGYGLIKVATQARATLRRWLPDTRFQVLALWLIPNLILYAPLVRAPGHTFSFMPALVILAAAALVMLGRNLAHRFARPASRITTALTGAVLITNIVFFLAAPPYLFGIQRVITTTPSWSTIQYRDRYIAERVAYITQHFDPATTLILTAGPDYRHPDYYLREYPTLNQQGDSLTSDAPAGAQTLVFFSHGLTSRQNGIQQAVLPGGDALLYLRLPAHSQIVVEGSEVSVQPQAQ
ncbi:MAG TPA: glycosyltransferase family 39 protein [Anaerolineae bacterium]